MKILPGLVALGVTALVSSVALAQAYDGPTTPPPADNNGGMNAGGLAPPPSNDQTQNSSEIQTEEELRKSEKEDSGRGLEFFYLNGEVGMEHLGLQTFKANHLVDANVVKSTQTGLMYGGGLGVRLVFLTLGARFRMGNFSDWQLWTLNGEVGLHIPLGNLEPYFTLGGGYASLGSFSAGNLGSNLNKAGVSIKGYDIRAGAGLDYYITPIFSVGANLTGEMLGLTRPGVSASKLKSSASGTGSTQQAAADVYAADGSSIGAAVSLTGVIGLHF